VGSATLPGTDRRLCAVARLDQARPVSVTLTQQPATNQVDRVATQLARELPEVSPAVLRREVEIELTRLGEVTVTQFLPVLVGRTVKHRLRHSAG
jgi:hypothetical protein